MLMASSSARNTSKLVYIEVLIKELKRNVFLTSVSQLLMALTRPFYFNLAGINLVRNFETK
jgi:hypothetical protein